jgi:1-acyl-sn-glycerol-3-phosphate acyltransferase
VNIFLNIPNGFKLFKSIYDYRHYLPKIEQLKSEGRLEEERDMIAELIESWVNRVVKTFDMHLTIEGKENIPEGPCAFYVNHQGYGDVPTMFKVCEGKQVGFVAKEDAKKIPLIGKWIESTEGVFIKRGETREGLKAIKEGAEKLKNGYSLIIFPEGTRNKNSADPTDIGEFKDGSFKIASKTGCKIVPVAITGTNKVFEDHFPYIKSANVIIEYGKPITIKELEPEDQKHVGLYFQNMIHEMLIGHQNL